MSSIVQVVVVGPGILASWELRSIMGFEEGDMKNIMNLKVGWKGATGLMQSTIRNGPNFV